MPINPIKFKAEFDMNEAAAIMVALMDRQQKLMKVLQKYPGEVPHTWPDGEAMPDRKALENELGHVSNVLVRFGVRPS